MEFKNIWVILALILVCLGALNFYIATPLHVDNFKGSTYQWPTQDVFIPLERVANPDFLPGDFVTETSVKKSPRIIYNKSVIFVSKFLGVDYLQILLALKLLLFMSLPATIFLALSKEIALFELGPEQKTLRSIILMLGISISNTTIVGDYFTVAHWTQIPYWPVPQTITNLLAFASWCAYREKGFSWISLILFFLAALFHLPNALFIGGFFVLFSSSWKEVANRLLTLMLPCLGVFILLKLFFASPGTLEGAIFVKAYVHNGIHGHHYLPEVYGYRNISFILGLLLVGGAWAMLLRAKRLFVLNCLFIASYVGACILQYLAIKLNLKLLVQLGPIRFGQVGYFMALFTWLNLFCIIFGPYILSKVVPSGTQDLRFLNGKWSSITIYILSGFFIVSPFFFLDFEKDNPRTYMQRRHPELLEWITRSTKPTDVIAAPTVLAEANLFTAIPLNARRGVYYANFLPFAESALQDHLHRINTLYNKPVCEWKKADVIEARKHGKLDWFVVPTSCADRFSDDFTAGYQGKNFFVFDSQPKK